MNNKELIEALRNIDEVVLLELLGVNSDEIVDAFLDLIEDDADRLTNYFNDSF